MAWTYVDIPNDTLSDAPSQINALAFDVKNWGGQVDANDYALINLPTPAAAHHAATKGYVDTLVATSAVAPGVEVFTGSTASSVVLAQIPDTAKFPVMVFRGGQLLTVTTDYTRTGATITLLFTRLIDDTIQVIYGH